MDNRIRVYMYLLEHRRAPCSIRAVAKALKMNYRIAFDAVKTLESQNTVKIHKIGNTSQCALAYLYTETALEAEAARKEQILKDKDIKIIYNNINELKDPFFICLLFGSYARREQKRGSDIDLCVISDDVRLIEKAARTIKMLALPINLISFSVSEFTSMLKTTDPNVGKEIVQNNVILIGGESFYRLVNYA